MTDAQLQEPEMPDAPICASVERDLDLRVDDLLATAKPWSFSEFDADVRRRLNIKPAEGTDVS